MEVTLGMWIELAGLFFALATDRSGAKDRRRIWPGSALDTHGI